MYLGIDLGGSKIEAAVLNAEGEVLFQQRVPTPTLDYLATLSAIETLVAQAERVCGLFSVVGIGTPGAVSQKTGAMKNCNSTCLNGRFLRQDLIQRLNREVRLANDANCFALSEAVDGAAQGARVVFGVILGTGVGGGVVMQQQALTGINAIAGEWGHNPMPSDVIQGFASRNCYCGRENCVETFLSGPGFARTYQELKADMAVSCEAIPDLIIADLSAQQIAGLALAGEPLALRALDCYVEQLASALSVVINILDPDVIVLGGGMSNLSLIYDRVAACLSGYVFSDSIKTQIKPPVYGDASGVRGAAWLSFPASV